MDKDASLLVEFRRLTEIVDAIEELQSGGMRGGNSAEFFFVGEPDRHRVNADVLPRNARHEQLLPMSPLDETSEGVRDLEPALVINFGGVVAPEHDCLLH